MSGLIQKLANALFGPSEKKPDYSTEDKETALAELKKIADLAEALALPANVFDLSSKSPSSRLDESRIGGKPAWPKDRPWPFAHDKSNLLFLAQINFADMPPLKGFPDKGLLQFFVNDGFSMGVAYKKADPVNHKVIFHNDPSSLGAAPSALDNYEWD